MDEHGTGKKAAGVGGDEPKKLFFFFFSLGIFRASGWRGGEITACHLLFPERDGGAEAPLIANHHFNANFLPLAQAEGGSAWVEGSH